MCSWKMLRASDWDSRGCAVYQIWWSCKTCSQICSEIPVTGIRYFEFNTRSSFWSLNTSSTVNVVVLQSIWSDIIGKLTVEEIVHHTTLRRTSADKCLCLLEHENEGKNFNVWMKLTFEYPKGSHYVEVIFRSFGRLFVRIVSGKAFSQNQSLDEIVLFSSESCNLPSACRRLSLPWFLLWSRLRSEWICIRDLEVASTSLLPTPAHRQSIWWTFFFACTPLVPSPAQICP